MSLFCPHLQSLLAPIYDLTRKGRPFVWTKLHEKNFEEIKKQMVSPPVLTPTHRYRKIHLILRHIQKSCWKVHYGRSRMESLDSLDMEARVCPKPVANYGITELEMTGLMYNMLTWKFWLGKKDFDAAVDHACYPSYYEGKTCTTHWQNW